MSCDGELPHGILVAPVRGDHERPQVHKRRRPIPVRWPADRRSLALADVDRPVRGGLLAAALDVRAQEDEGVRGEPGDAGRREPREAPGRRRGGGGRGRRVRGARKRAAPAEREDLGEVRLGTGGGGGGGGGAGVEEGAEGLGGRGGGHGGGGGGDSTQRVGGEGVGSEVDCHGRGRGASG